MTDPSPTPGSALQRTHQDVILFLSAKGSSLWWGAEILRCPPRTELRPMSRLRVDLRPLDDCFSGGNPRE